MSCLPDVSGLPVLDPLHEVADLSVSVVALDAGLAVDDPVVVVHLDAVAVGREDGGLTLKLVVLQKAQPQSFIIKNYSFIRWLV